ncbi:MAG: ATP synthase F0 subunit C [Acidobacteriota bacterium]
MLKKSLLIGVIGLACLALPAIAQEPAAAAVTQTGVRWGALSAAFLLGIAAAAGAMAQGRATSSAAEAMSRNPAAAGPIRLMTIIGLALIESLVLYALLIASNVSKL